MKKNLTAGIGIEKKFFNNVSIHIPLLALMQKQYYQVG
jgi:hypothetical protein